MGRLTVEEVEKIFNDLLENYEGDEYSESDLSRDHLPASNYEEWLEQIGEDDSELLREWYELDDSERAEWLENHPEF